MIHAKDLSKEPPRGPRERIGGYPILARMIDKGRAALNGTTGEYEFNCGLDQMLFRFKGIDYEEVKQLLATGASDDEVLDWINSHGIPKTSAQIEEFSNSFEEFRPYNDPKLRQLFAETYGALGLDPKTSTVADYLEEDDRVAFKNSALRVPQSAFHQASRLR
jgi:Domain of unknown function (DUF5069)